MSAAPSSAEPPWSTTWATDAPQTDSVRQPSSGCLVNTHTGPHLDFPGLVCSVDPLQDLPGGPGQTLVIFSPEVEHQGVPFWVLHKGLLTVLHYRATHTHTHEYCFQSGSLRKGTPPRINPRLRAPGHRRLQKQHTHGAALDLLLTLHNVRVGGFLLETHVQVEVAQSLTQPP